MSYNENSVGNVSEMNDASGMNNASGVSDANGMNVYLMARDYKFFEAARKAAEGSTFKVKVGAVGVYGHFEIERTYS